MPAIGFLIRKDDESFEGELITLTVRSDLKVQPVSTKSRPTQADYVVYAQGMEIGEGWRKINQGSGREYVSLSLAAPEFGAKPITANLGAVNGKDNSHFAVIWNPEG